MHVRRTTFLIAALAALLSSPPLRAQSVGPTIGGPYVPIVLVLPAGARTLALGNTGVASRDDDAAFFNPAMVAVARGTSVSAEHYAASANGGALSSVTRFSSGGIAVGMRMVDYQSETGAFATTRGTMTEFGAEGTSLEALASLAQVVKGYRVGASAKYAEDQMSTVRLSRGLLDLGLSKDYFQSYTVGLAVQNIGSDVPVVCGLVRNCTLDPTTRSGLSPEMTQARMPLRTTLGVATAKPAGPFDLYATAAVSMLRASWVSPSGGAELGYSWLDGYSIAVRAGARRPLPGEGAFTAGAGFTMDRLSIDYALESLGASRVAHRVGLRIR